MQKHDVLLSINGALEWICGIYHDDINSAIACAVLECAPAEYINHKSFIVVDGQWVEYASVLNEEVQV
jgi:hypothetical protein